MEIVEFEQVVGLDKQVHYLYLPKSSPSDSDWRHILHRRKTSNQNAYVGRDACNWYSLSLAHGMPWQTETLSRYMQVLFKISLSGSLSSILKLELFLSAHLCIKSVAFLPQPTPSIPPPRMKLAYHDRRSVSKFSRIRVGVLKEENEGESPSNRFVASISAPCTYLYRHNSRCRALLRVRWR